MVCGMCNAKGPEVTVEAVGCDKGPLQRAFDTNEELLAEIE